MIHYVHTKFCPILGGHLQTFVELIWNDPLAITLVLKFQLQQIKHFCIPCNELIHMAHLNQNCFSPQSLSCSYHRLTSMQMGLVVICSSSISHNFGFECPIPTSQAFFM